MSMAHSLARMSSNGDAFAVDLRAAARDASPADSALAGDSAVTRWRVGVEVGELEWKLVAGDGRWWVVVGTIVTASRHGMAVPVTAISTTVEAVAASALRGLHHRALVSCVRPR